MKIPDAEPVTDDDLAYFWDRLRKLVAQGPEYVPLSDRIAAHYARESESRRKLCEPINDERNQDWD